MEAPAPLRIANSRRGFLKASAIGLLAFTVAGCDRQLSPTDARKAGADFKVLSPPEVAILDMLAEVLVPGARDSGLSHFVDAGLAIDPADGFLMIRYLDVPPPWAGFYQSGLAALDAQARAAHAVGFADLPMDKATALVGRIAAAPPDGWPADAPPSPFFYFAVRGDAVDVVYGTMAGFERLDVPYLAHIEPTADWPGARPSGEQR